jgi:hypothetical protein
LFSSANPNSGIRTDLCIIVLVLLEHIEDVGVDFLIVTLLFAYVHICGIVGLQVASQLNLHVLLRETGSTTDIRLVSHKWLGRCQFLLFTRYDFCNGGPLSGVKETINESPLWLHARR